MLSGGLRARCAAHQGADIACGFGVLVRRSTNVGFVPARRLRRDRFGVPLRAPGAVCRLSSCAAASGLSSLLRRAPEGAVFISGWPVLGSRLRLRCHTCRPWYVPVRRVLLSLRVLLDATSARVIHSTPTRWLEPAGGCILALAAWCSSDVAHSSLRAAWLPVSCSTPF